MNKRCANCRFFVRFVDVAVDKLAWKDDGLCYRFPKEIRKEISDWCGEFKPKKKEVEPCPKS